LLLTANNTPIIAFVSDKKNYSFHSTRQINAELNEQQQKQKTCARDGRKETNPKQHRLYVVMCNII
jgi:hypothetical protein